ncbi:glucan 1,3-beta-glucosidase [Ophiocordyceps sinensis CO18]|uniref:Glucan 1,3-beta-glucosidase n=1 Tax=Ophiocordyceps sinensis (strain Co18 / CGMCC 3.14243) TaxID=911162 RepID=T5A809_OPHSC|nr:glucan 1,3-beta-glucosidase [Ophiocordyceps sinensis CO18]
MDPEPYPNGYFGRPVVPSAATSANATPLRPGTPNTDGSRNPFGDNDTASSHRPGASTNTFGSPDASRPASSYGSSSALGRGFEERSQRYFHSRRVRKGDMEKPWLDKRDPKEKWVTILPIVGILMGLAISGFLVWDGIRSVVRHKYCPVMDDSFDSGFNANVWTKEVAVGGFGNGEFQQTTGNDENVFVQDGNLVIKATLQDADKVEKDNVINLLKDGTCTSKDWYSCVAATNTTAGNSSVVPPTKSGRINTKKGAKIRYGRVEVTAKLPEGDWLWPAIWMMPVKDTYGSWPSSGEIDIMESRGNNWTYGQGGNDMVSSALHWGPDAANDAWWKTNNKHGALHTTYSKGFNTFGLEWTQKYIFTYVNSRLLQVLFTNFDKPMWKRGGFPESNSNGTRLADVWSQTGRDNTPFDHDFYLVINLAVGGTNGWFEDSKSGKPWLDRSDSAKKDFWKARDAWYPTWKQPRLEVSRVVMMQQCDGNEEL